MLLVISHSQKTPHVACVVYLVSVCTCFWLKLNRCTRTCFFFAFAQTNPDVLEGTRKKIRHIIKTSFAKTNEAAGQRGRGGGMRFSFRALGQGGLRGYHPAPPPPDDTYTELYTTRVLNGGWSMSQECLILAVDRVSSKLRIAFRQSGCSARWSQWHLFEFYTVL